MKIKIVSAVVGVLLALGLIGGTAVWAQGGTQTQGSQPNAAGTRCAENQTALAGKLGISVDKLQQAMMALENERIDKALKDGKLTADQAAKAKQQVTDSKGCFGAGHVGGRGGLQGAGRQAGQVALDAAAKALGMTPQQLMQEMRSGKSITDIAKAKNVDVKTVRDAVIAAEKAAIDQAVKDGKLTQTQADKLKDALTKNADKILDRFQNHRAPKKTR